MSTGREPRRCVTADEQDVHTGWRHVMCSFKRAGAAAAAKRRSNRRERRERRAETRARGHDERFDHHERNT